MGLAQISDEISFGDVVMLEMIVFSLDEEVLIVWEDFHGLGVCVFLRAEIAELVTFLG